MLEALFDSPLAIGCAQLYASGSRDSGSDTRAARPVCSGPKKPQRLPHDKNCNSGFSHSLWLRNRQITMFCEGVPGPGTHTARREGHAMLGRITDAIFERKSSSVRRALGAFAVSIDDRSSSCVAHRGRLTNCAQAVRFQGSAQGVKSPIFTRTP